MSDLDEFRREKDDFFRQDRQSPLTREQKKAFKGLNYFPEAPELRFEVSIERFKDPEEVTIQTSTGDTQTYQRYGRIQFPIQDETQTLTVFANEQGFFLPFVDSLAGK